MKKKALIFIIAFLFFILAGSIFLVQFFSPDKLKGIIESEFQKHTENILKIGFFDYSFSNGLQLDFKNVKILSKDKTEILTIGNYSIKLQILPLFSKTLLFDNVFIKNTNLTILENKGKTSSKKSIKSPEKNKSKKFPFKIIARNIQVENFSAHYKTAKLHIENFILNNFSLHKPFKFVLVSDLIVDKQKGEFVSTGKIDLSKSEVNVDIKGKNLNLNFLKIKNLTFGNTSIDFNFNGKVCDILNSNLKISIEDVKYNKLNKIHFKKLDILSSVCFENNDIIFKNTKFSFDNNINIIGKGKITSLKHFDFTFSSKILTKNIINYIPLQNLEIDKSGIIVFDKIKFSGSFDKINRTNIFVKAKCSELSGKFKNYNFSNVSFDGELLNNIFRIKNLTGDFLNSSLENFNISYKNDVVSATGDIKANLKDFPKLGKKLTLSQGQIDIKLKKLLFPVKNIKKITFQGNYKIFDSIVSYDFFNNINIKSLTGDFKNNEINVKKAIVKFRNIDYFLNGHVKNFLKKPVKINFNISSNTFDEFIATKILKLKIGNCKNIVGNVNLSGELTDKLRLSLKNGKIIFKNSKVNFYNYIFDNITGTASFSNNIVNIDNIKFVYNKGHYFVKGNIISPFKNHQIDIFVQTDTIDEYITKLINLNRVENIKIKAHLTGSFNKINIESANLKFLGSNLIYNKYKPKKIFGTIEYKNNVGKLKNISLYLNNIKYIINGQLINPFTGLEFSINAKTNTIDSFFLKQANLPIDTIHNLNANFNITGKLKNKKLSLLFTNSVINFKNSDIKFINKKINIKDVSGTMILNNNKLTFNNIKSHFLEGILFLNGYFSTNNIKKGYFYITGENFKINSAKLLEEDKTKQKIKHNNDNISKKDNFIKKLFEFLQNIDVTFNINLNNVLTEVNKYKNINLDAQLNKSGIFIKNCMLKTEKNNGSFNINKGFLKFSKQHGNIFLLNIKYNNINIGDIFNFIIPRKSFEFYGDSKNCYINLVSKFKDFNDFYKHLNGNFNINFQNGFINKASFVASVFSLLNISQVLEFKLPDLHTKGFKYKYLKGKFTVKNGIINTKNLKLKGNSFDMIYVGDIDLNKKIFNANIAVYPLKTVDKILKYIPLIGYLFKDENGRKKIITTYLEITGPISKPSIKILPLKSIGNRIGSMFKNLIELPINIIKKPDEVIVPGTK